jgi:acyl-CoA thioester hydrolase
MYLGDPGRTSVGSYYEIWMNGRKYADGAAKIVWIDLASGRSVPLPEAVAAPLRALDRSQPTSAG